MSNSILVLSPYKYNGIWVSKNIVRLNADGTLDTTFNNGCAANVSNCGFSPAYANTVAVQSDGKLLVGGGFTTYRGATVNRITAMP